MMVSVLHKELEYKVEKLKYKKLKVMQSRIKLIQSRAIRSLDTVYHLLVKNNKGEGKGRGGGL